MFVHTHVSGCSEQLVTCRAQLRQKKVNLSLLPCCYISVPFLFIHFVFPSVSFSCNGSTLKYTIHFHVTRVQCTCTSIVLSTKGLLLYQKMTLSACITCIKCCTCQPQIVFGFFRWPTPNESQQHLRQLLVETLKKQQNYCYIKENKQNIPLNKILFFMFFMFLILMSTNKSAAAFCPKGFPAGLLFNMFCTKEYFLYYEHPQQYFKFIKSFWLSLKDHFPLCALVYAPLNCQARKIRCKHKPIKHLYKATKAVDNT